LESPGPDKTTLARCIVGLRSVAQAAMVLRNGEIVESGPVEQVFARPASDYTARLMADVPKLARQAAGR
jgi:peptide/nickel transport system ATP-binding protein